MWLVAYYLLPGTLLGRISPGALVTESAFPRPRWLVASGALSLSVAAAAVLCGRRLRGYRPSNLLLCLLVLMFCAPLLVDLAGPAGRAGSALASGSVLVALSTGVLAARLAGESAGSAMACVCLVQAAYAITYVRLGTLRAAPADGGLALGSFGDATDLATVMLVALPFPLAASLRARGAPVQFAHLCSASAVVAALLLTRSWAGIVGLAGTLTALTYFLSRSRRLAGTLLASLVCLCAFVQLLRLPGAGDPARLAASNAVRAQLWAAAWTDIRSHPLAGVGAGRFEAVVALPAGEPRRSARYAEPQSLYLHWLAERGLAGGLLFLLFVWAVARALRRWTSSGHGPATAAAWIGLLAAGLVATPFGPPERCAGNCCAGLLLGIATWAGRGVRQPHGSDGT